MKKATISIPCDSEKLAAVKMYLSQKDLTVENELGKALDVLYGKHVPANVREFLELRDQGSKTFVRKNKITPTPAILHNDDRSGSE